MKSQVDCLLQVAQGLLLGDFPAAYPALRGSFVKDFDRLTLNCRERGRTFLTLDLPQIDTMLTRGLETGRLVLNGPLTRAVSNRVRVPRFLSGLWLRVFDESACLKEDADINAIFFIRQISRFAKNLAVDCSHRRREAAVRSYYDVERELRRPSLDWESDKFNVQDTDDRHLGDVCNSLGKAGAFSVQEEVQKDLFEDGVAPVDLGLARLLNQVQCVSDLVAETIGRYDPLWHSYLRESHDLPSGFRHGPGAVSEGFRNWEKSQFRNWPNKLEGVFRQGVLAMPVFSSGMPLAKHEPPSRLLAVPKTAKGPRLIAAEPTSHMWCQQGIKQFLLDRMNSSFIGKFIDLRKQQLSGDLVLKASLDRKLATVDLSDASDRLTCWTVERVFRRNSSLLRALHAARTRYIRVDIPGCSDFLKPKKFATQGTAVTFPIQSLVFFCIAIGVCLDGDVSEPAILKLRNQVRIYGDDIIIPRYGYERLCRVMTYLQLKVNETKCFKDGHFRESCGTDGYKGYDVTPVSPKDFAVDTLSRCQSVIDSVNNLFNKGFWHASERLRSQIPVRVQHALRIVGRDGRGTPGLSSFSGSCESHLAKRWNTRLHRNEVRVWSLRDQPRQKSRGGYPALLDFVSSQYSHERARTVSVYAEYRKTKYGLTWEPLSNPAQQDDHQPVRWDTFLFGKASNRHDEIPLHGTKSGRCSSAGRVFHLAA